jgi:hypothetical protein
MNAKLTKSARGGELGAWSLRPLAIIYLRFTPYFVLRSLLGLGQQSSGGQSSEFRVPFVEDVEDILITVCSITFAWIQTDVETCY